MAAMTLLAFDVIVFFVDLRGLRESGLLLMYRLRNDNARVIFVQLQQQRRAFFHHRDELLVTDPRGIKQDVITQMTDFIDHLTRVVHGTVISTKLDNRQAERTFFSRAMWRHFFDLCSQISFIETSRINAADKTERITRCFEINRRSARLQQRTVMV